MRKLALAALLVALATPAWAGNDAERSTTEDWIAAQKICIRLGVNNDICAMKNAPSERMALGVAEGALDLCDKDMARAG